MVYPTFVVPQILGSRRKWCQMFLKAAVLCVTAIQSAASHQFYRKCECRRGLFFPEEVPSSTKKLNGDTVL